jgi:hypothetical protein
VATDRTEVVVAAVVVTDGEPAEDLRSAERSRSAAKENECNIWIGSDDRGWMQAVVGCRFES